MSRVKVLHMVSHLGLGGCQIVAKGIVESTTHEPYLCVLRPSKKEILIDISEQNIYRLHVNLKYSLSAVPVLLRIILTHNIQIVHCHMFQTQVLATIVKLFLFNRVRLIFHEHGEVEYGGFLYKIFLLLSQFFVHKYIVVSMYVEGRLSSLLFKMSRKKIVLMYNFVPQAMAQDVDNSQNTKLTRNLLEIDSKKFIVGFAGRIVALKGWRDFISTAEILEEKNPCKFHFLIAGDGVDFAEMQRVIIKKSMSKYVTCLGRLEDTMPEFYNLLDCLVIPSYSEQCSLVVIEAQVKNVPVVASDVPGLNELFIDNSNGLLFPVGNICKIVEKVQILESDRVFANTICINAQNSIKLYDLSAYMNKIDKLYTEIARKKQNVRISNQ